MLLLQRKMSCTPIKTLDDRIIKTALRQAQGGFLIDGFVLKKPLTKVRDFFGDPTGSMVWITKPYNIASFGRICKQFLHSLRLLSNHGFSSVVRQQQNRLNESDGFVGDPTGSRTPLSRMKTWRPNR